jgi:hypothetical protein
MDRSYSIGFEYIDDTAAHTGRFWQLYALADAVIASAVIENQTGYIPCYITCQRKRRVLIACSGVLHGSVAQH